MFKRKGRSSDSFRYPQGFKLDERNSRVFLPKIGWVRYRNSRRLPGNSRPKSLTVSHSADGWHMSVQFEFANTPKAAAPDLHAASGIDMGGGVVFNLKRRNSSGKPGQVPRPG